MARFENTDEQDDLTSALGLLRGLVEFAEIQEREGHVDGAADPSMSVDIAKDLLAKYNTTYDDVEYALQA